LSKSGFYAANGCAAITDWRDYCATVCDSACTSPRHADALLATGPVSRHMETALRRTWRATPSPKYVIAAGSCACDGGEFGVSYASCGAVENVIPVDVKIPGCPPSPLVLLKGLLAAIENSVETK
jgi:Ni,Fe-hydrogenase III small subunit